MPPSAPPSWPTMARLRLSSSPSTTAPFSTSTKSRIIPQPPPWPPRAAATSATSALSVFNHPPRRLTKPSPFAAAQQVRTAVGVGGGYRGTRQLSEKERTLRRKADALKRKATKDFHCPKLDGYPKFSLCDAMRILRATEVGQPSKSVKYELFVRMRTSRSGPVVKSRIKLPHPIQGDDRVAVICPENSPIAAEALAAGAVLAGEETLFKAIRAGEIHFTKLICHASSEPALNKANLGRVLGPKGLMPNKKNHTITANLKGMMRDMVGTIDYRERSGVVRMAIGQLNHSPKQLSENVAQFMREVKSAVKRIASGGKQTKALHEVVLSTTHGPGISLNGLFNPTDDSITPEDLSGTM